MNENRHRMVGGTCDRDGCDQAARWLVGTFSAGEFLCETHAGQSAGDGE